MRMVSLYARRAGLATYSRQSFCSKNTITISKSSSPWLFISSVFFTNSWQSFPGNSLNSEAHLLKVCMSEIKGRRRRRKLVAVI